jgi:hypothetical protein
MRQKSEILSEEEQYNQNSAIHKKQRCRKDTPIALACHFLNPRIIKNGRTMEQSDKKAK